jgi:(S)-ureidoglycine aminohydrolase
MNTASKERPLAERTYYAPRGGLPAQTDLLTDRAVFTETYAVIPKGCPSSDKLGVLT